MKRSEKHDFVTWMKGELESAQSLVVADYRGLTVAKISDLRIRCDEAGVKFKVAKNTLMRLAVSESSFEPLGEFLTGPTAIAWHDEDPGAAARVLSDFAKEKGNEALEIKGAVVGGKTINAAEVANVLAKLPTREELLGRMAGLLAAGPTKLARVLGAGPAKLGRVIGALEEKKKEAA